MKPKSISETQFMSLLQKVLPETIPDARLASALYERVAQELRLIRSLERFEKFCSEGALPDLEPSTVTNLKQDLGTTFGDDKVSVTPAEDQKSVEVEIALPDRTVNTTLRVASPDDPVVTEEVKAPFVGFPVSLPEDPELIWLLARRENVGPDEANRALAGAEEEFWASKAGLELQKDRVERTFAEFIANVPAGMLADRGLKRLYRDPETRRTLVLLPPGPANTAE